MTPELEPGSMLDRYRIEQKLGEGGMGRVYRAVDTRLGRTVAVKVVNAEFTHRFEREARAISALNHPHICTLYDVGEYQGVPYLVMEYVEGRPLKGPLPAGQALRYAIQTAEGLAAAHKAGIVHRDLKPDNILLTSQGSVKVLDFGLAKLQPSAAAQAPTVTTMTEQGAVTGTVPYMSPEQAQGEPVDGRSDIFSFGAVLYELLSGRRAFRGETMGATLAAVIAFDPPPLKEAPPEIGRIVGRMLAKKPEDRYQSAEELLADLEAAAAPGTRLRSRRVWLSVAAAGVVLGAVLAGLDLDKLRSRLPGGGAPRVRSLAVLPVANLSGDPEQEYFADGMTDALIADLSKVGALRVISRTSVMPYKGTKKRLPEIARELKVDNVVEASLVRDAGRVRVTAKLLEAATERQLWAESYEREISSVLALQSDVARTIARAIGVRMRPQEEDRLGRTRRVDPETYQAYLRGMFFLNKGTPEGTAKGLEYLHQAVERDPADPLAQAGLAVGYITRAHGPEAKSDDLQRARAAAQTAVRLDPTLAEAILAMAFVEGYYEWKWEDAFRDIERALDVNPSMADAYFHRSWYEALFGRMEEAIADHKRAQELDPFSPPNSAWLGELYRWEGRYDEAIAEARKAIELAPESDFPVGHYVLGLVYSDQGRHDEAIQMMQKAAALSPSWRWAVGLVQARAGRTGEARKVLAELNRQKPAGYESWNNVWRVMLHSALGDTDEAFRWLNQEPHHAWIPWFRVIPGWGFENLRADPRFADALRRMNLPPLAGAEPPSRGRRKTA